MSEDCTKYEVLYNHNTLIETRQFDPNLGSIYTITLVPEKNGERCRCFGFFLRFSDALYHINKYGLNGLTDEAGLYKYIVIEKMFEGLYASSEEFDQTWFEADHELNKWKEIKKPANFKSVINFGIG